MLVILFGALLCTCSCVCLFYVTSFFLFLSLLHSLRIKLYIKAAGPFDKSESAPFDFVTNRFLMKL